MKYLAGLICGLLVVVLLAGPAIQERIRPWLPDGKLAVPETLPLDAAGKAFAVYEKLWRKHIKDTADSLDAGNLDSEKAAGEFMAAGQAPARKIAFDEIAKAEQAYFVKNGGWSAKKHAALLRSYSK